MHAVRVGFVTGLNDVFLVGAIVAFVSAVLTLALIRSKDFEVSAARTGAEPGPQGQSAPAPPGAPQQASATPAPDEEHTPVPAASGPSTDAAFTHGDGDGRRDSDERQLGSQPSR